MDYLMISFPRVIPFELMMIDWAIKILEKHGEIHLFKRSSLESDQAELQLIADKSPIDWQLYTILKCNIVSKQIFNDHLKLLQVLKAIVMRLKGVPEEQLMQE